MKKKRKSQTALWIGLFVFAGIAMAISLNDQGFFNRAAVVSKAGDDGHGHDEAQALSEADQKKASMAAAARNMKPAPNPNDPAERVQTAPQKPKPNPTSTGSQWYKDDSGTKAESK